MKNVKKQGDWLLDIVYYGYWIIAIMVKVYYFQFNSELNSHPINDFGGLNVRMLTSSLAIILIILGFTIFLFNKKRRFSLFIINLVLGLILFSDALYFRYYNTPTNLALIYQIGYVGDISSSIKSLIRYQDVVFLIDLPIYFFCFFLGKTVDKHVYQRKITWGISFIAIVVGLVVFNMNYKASNTILYNYDRNYAARDLSILYYHAKDIKDFLMEETVKKLPMQAEDKEKIKKYYDDKKELQQGTVGKGSAKDMNLIIIQIEALQGFAVEGKIKDEPITPFLNDLIKDSYYFTNIYHQVAGGNTSDAEFMTNNSLYPAASGAAYFRYGNNTLPSLGNKLKLEGYKTYAAHAFRPSFWNRQAVYKTEGFDTFLSQNDYLLDEKIGWAVSDESFYRQTMEKIDTANPFYAFMVSLSSHHPYDGFNYIDNIDVGPYKGTQLGNFIKAARYDDTAIKSLFEDLKKRGLYDNTIVVMYGDHSALFEDQAKDLTSYLKFQKNPFTWQRLQKVPLIVHIPGQRGARIDTVGGQVDILPTIANLMDIELPYTMGKDLLNTKEGEGYALLRDSSVMLKDTMYLSKTGKYYDMATGAVINEPKDKKRVEAIQKELTISDLMLGKDYFRVVRPKEK